MSDYARPGRYKMVCDFSGFVGYNDEMVKNWNGAWVLRRFADVRNPQDFLKGAPEGPPPKITRPEPPEAVTVTAVASLPLLLNSIGGSAAPRRVLPSDL